MKKFVIFTAIVGNYDKLQQPEMIDDRFDYILFSNNISQKQIGMWQVRNIPYYNKDYTRVARWVKTHPEELLNDYEASLWIDGALVINKEFVYNRIIDLYDNDYLIASMWHNQRNCIYKEAAEVVFLGLEHERIVIDWLRKIRKEKYPENNGLFETNVIYRKHNDKKIKEIDQLWWQCIDQFSRRDQLSFNYVLWKVKIDCLYFISAKENARNSSHFKCVTNHVNDSKQWRKISINKKDDILFYYYNKMPQNAISSQRLCFWYKLITKFWFPHKMAFIIGQYYKIKKALVSLKNFNN